MASLCHIGIDCFSRGYSRYGGVLESSPSGLSCGPGRFCRQRASIVAYVPQRVRHAPSSFSGNKIDSGKLITYS